MERCRRNSLFFSVLAGNLAVETGSTTTASATTQSFETRDFPKHEENDRVGGLLRGRSVSGDFGLSPSGVPGDVFSGLRTVSRKQRRPDAETGRQSCY